MINWRQGDSGNFPQWNKQPHYREQAYYREQRPAYEYQEQAPDYGRPQNNYRAHEQRPRGQPRYQAYEQVRQREQGPPRVAEREASFSDLESRSGRSADGRPMTEQDKAVLRDLDLLEDDDSPLPQRDFNPVLKANPLESFSLERDRSRELEKNENNKENSLSKSPETSIGKKRRLKKAGDAKEIPKVGIEKGHIQNRLMDIKLQNLKKNTGQLADIKPRRVSESTKPSLNLMIPKGFETKESFSRRFKVLESLGEGGSSIVRKVSCRRDGKVCAVKSCKSNDDSSTKYIKKELKILQSLSHPNIIKPYGIFESTSNVIVI